jgi:hypothetical protein
MLIFEFLVEDQKIIQNSFCLQKNNNNSDFIKMGSFGPGMYSKTAYVEFIK